MRTLVLSGTILLLAASAYGQEQGAPAPPPNGQAEPPIYRLQSTVREVNLDIVVTDAKGRPVQGLTRDDFRILDEGQPQSLRGFNEHNGLKAAATPEFKLPPNTFTNHAPVGNSETSFIILFDSLDTPIEYQIRAYVQAQDFLKDLAPGTSVAIFDLNQRMTLVQGFTTDRALLLDALKDKRAQPKASYLLGSGNEVWRKQILDDGMALLGRYLLGFPGRKNLIWFVVNIPGSLNERTASISAGGGPSVGTLAGAQVAADTAAAPVIQALQPTVGAVAGDQRTPLAPSNGPPPQNGASLGQVPPNGATTNRSTIANSDNLFQNLTNLIDDTSSTSDVLTLSKVVVYTVDPRELPGPDISMSDPNYLFEHAAMDDVAEATGGRSFYNRNGLTSIMQEIVAKGSDYYTLTYSPKDIKWDGTFRKLKVQLVGAAAQTRDVAALHLEYRPGYHATDRLTPNRAQESGLKLRGTNSEDFRLASESGTSAGVAGALPKESLQASMTMGQIPPTELILNASVKPSVSPLKLTKGQALPDGDFMRDKFKQKPYHLYDVLFVTDVHGLQLPRSPDGLHHGGVQFVAVVYSDEGDVVNSFSVTISLNLRDDSYRTMLQTGMGTKHSIAIPIKGKYVVRLGVHDLSSDRVGALEFPLASLDMAAVGVGQEAKP